jgi:hypothetical protein
VRPVGFSRGEGFEEAQMSQPLPGGLLRGACSVFLHVAELEGLEMRLETCGQFAARRGRQGGRESGASSFCFHSRERFRQWIGHAGDGWIDK